MLFNILFTINICPKMHIIIRSVKYKFPNTIILEWWLLYIDVLYYFKIIIMCLSSYIILNCIQYSWKYLFIIIICLISIDGLDKKLYTVLQDFTVNNIPTVITILY